ncbi:fibronectin type III domain-containing protein [Flavobacterium psychrophilum]|uniref:fibronectin type III domain-containing protein n=1 Tax=Flavobacterium psychrophilum TaxID=96345 RepID=UPI003139E0C7
MIRNLFQLFFLLISFQFFGQVYPVQITPIFNTPYSSRVSDYATSMDVKMQLLINPSDISITNRQVRLKMYLQGNNINAQSVDYVNGINPIYINGGELLTLTNLDIAALFRLENLQGISPAQYSNALPEGMYNVCFELYDFATNQRISQKSCAYLYLMLNDPPLLNTPAKNESIAVSDFPNILFTWTPRQLNATNVSYEFEIKEILDPTIDPQIGFLTSPTLYDETLYSTALLYDSSKPNLLAGKRYAWRVRAMSTSGLSLNNVFKNDGYSEIHHFTYASNCPAPTFILSEALSARSVRISWQGDNSHTKYHLQYKKANVSRAEWFEVYTMNTQTTLTDLEAGVTYEFRVGGSCEPAVLGNRASFTYSGINNFTLPAVGTTSSSFTCGLNPAVAIANQTPITNLIVTETFTAGDFPVKILELTGNNPYNGKGYIIVPYLADTKIAVVFNNITINTNYQLINGIVETSYNPQAPNINDLEDLTGGNNGVIITQTISFVITTVTTNPNGDIIVSGANGEQIAIPGGSNTVITGTTATGGTGSIYNVDSQGNVTGPFMPAPGGATTPQNTDGVATNGQTTQFAAQGLTIAFEPTTATKYSWDIVPDTAPTYIKDKYAKIGSAYLPYKAVVNGQSDVLKTKITLADATIVLDSIVFKTQHGVLLDKVKQGNDYMLTLKGTQTYGEEEVQAVIKQGGKYKVAGAFRLVHVSEKTLNITLVPLNNTTSIPNNAIRNLQTNYEKAGVKLTIKTAPVLMYDGEADAKITTSDSGLFDYYTDEEKSINAKIKALSDYNNKSYYLIYSNLPSDKGIEGFMALGGQFGYVFPNASSKTASHELGHGAFVLAHPFASDGDKGKTPFLMDYGSGTELWHNDWAQINNPALKYYGFQGDSQGEFVGYRLTPDWKPFSFSGSSTYISGNIKEPNGAVYGISYNDEDYLAVLEGGKYIYKSGQKVLPGFTAVDNLKEDADVILFWNRGVCGYSETYTSKWSYLKDKIGFNIDDVTDSGKIVFKERVPCKVNGVNQGSTVADKECDNKDISVLNSQKNALVALIDDSDVEKITTKINEVDVCTIRKLTYEQIERFIIKISSLSDLDERHEKALLRLMNGIKEDKYKIFYTLLESDSNKLIKHYIDEFTDHSINPFDGDNYTSLNTMLLKMYQSNSKAWIDRIPSGELSDYFVDKYFTKPTVKILSLNDLISGTSEIYEQGFQYNPDNGKIRITHTATAIQAIAGNSSGAYYAPVGAPRIMSVLEVDPLTPVVIDFNDDLQVIEIALNNAGYQKGKEVIIPALFLKFGLDKLNSNSIQKSSLFVLNGMTIVTGMPAIIQGATRAKRLWALAEVAGAAGDIVVNTQYVQTNYPRLATATNVFNGAMGLVGLKNLVTNTGIRSFATNLPSQVKQAFKDNKEIKSIIAAKYLDWKVAVTELKDINPIEQQLITQQEKVWKAFGFATKIERFIAKTGAELKTYLNVLNDLPKGVTYEGDFIKSISKNAEELHNAKPDIISDYSIEESWGRYDTQGESAMYYSKTYDGNQTEMSFYGNWDAYSTYQYGNVKIENMLDLSNQSNLERLATEFDKLVLGISDKSKAYEYTNVIGTWARQKGYKGLIVSGARGNKDYVNIIVFDQVDLTSILKSITPVKLK